MIWRSPWYPRLVFFACLVPLAVLAWQWGHHELGVNPIEHNERYLGRCTLRFLLLTLCITPLRRLPKLGGLIRIRRMLGLFTFFYGCIHGLYYFAVDAQWSRLVIVDDLTHRKFFIYGMLALVLMAPLAATSSDRAVRWMGGKRWRRLHRLIYISAVFGVIHYALQNKGIVLTPLYYGAAVLMLFVVRVGFVIRNRLRRPQTVHA